MTEQNIGGVVAKSLLVIAAMVIASIPAVAQESSTPPAQNQQSEFEPQYRPPPRGAPGGRVSGASRGTIQAMAPLPTVELLAPDGHAGLTANPAPTLYFFASQPVAWPTQFTISAPGRANPLVEVNLPAPRQAGVYAIHTTDYHVRLEPGVIYTWSVSVILNPETRSHDIVASASLVRTRADPSMEGALRSASASQRAALLARAGLWYDAVDAAALQAFDRHAALDALMDEVGLVEPARYDRLITGGDRSR